MARPLSLHRGVFTFGLCLVTSFVAVVACGTDGSRQMITVRPGSDASGGGQVRAGVDACQAQIIKQRYEVRIENAKVGSSGKAPSNQMCQVTDASAIGDYLKNPSKAPPYGVVETPLRYTVNNNNGKLEVDLKIGLDLPADMPDPARKAIVQTISSSCVPLLAKAWEASQFDVGLAVSVDAIDPVLNDSLKFDQVLTLLGPAQADAKTYPAYAMYSWPDRGQLVPYGNGADVAKCPQSGPDAARCIALAKANGNQAFCATFGRVVGQWLGLSSGEVQAGACTTAVAAKPAKSHAPAASAGFMQAAAQATSPDEFWAKARFTSQDLKTILSPACPGL